MVRVATVVVLTAVVLAGCSGGGTSTPTQASGSTATIDSEAVEEAGFTHVGTAERRLNATLRAELEGDIEVTEVLDVSATVPVSQYRRSTDDGPVVVAVAASPSVELVENPPTSRDPLSTLETSQLVAFVQDTYTNATALTLNQRESVTVLGNETTLVTYHGRASTDDSSHPVNVSVARTEHGGDVVTLVAVAPRGEATAEKLGLLSRSIAH